MVSSIRALLRYPSYIFAATFIYLFIVYISPSATISYLAGILVASPFLIGVLAGEDIRAKELIRNYFSIRGLSYFTVLCVPFVSFIIINGMILNLTGNIFVSSLISVTIFSVIYNIVAQFLYKIATGKEYLETRYINVVHVAVFMALFCLVMSADTVIPQPNWVVSLFVSLLVSTAHIVLLFLITTVILPEESK